MIYTDTGFTIGYILEWDTESPGPQVEVIVEVSEIASTTNRTANEGNNTFRSQRAEKMMKCLKFKHIQCSLYNVERTR